MRHEADAVDADDEIVRDVPDFARLYESDQSAVLLWPHLQGDYFALYQFALQCHRAQVVRHLPLVLRPVRHVQASHPHARPGVSPRPPLGVVPDLRPAQYRIILWHIALYLRHEITEKAYNDTDIKRATDPHGQVAPP